MFRNELYFCTSRGSYRVRLRIGEIGLIHEKRYGLTVQKNRIELTVGVEW
jgi:hypothetical protein